MKFRSGVICLSLLASALLTGGVNAQTGASDSGWLTVNLRFEAQVNGQAFECGKSYAHVGSTQATITPSDFRLYVSEVALLNTRNEAVPLKLVQDAIWQFEDIALLDFENGAGAVPKWHHRHERSGSRRGASRRLPGPRVHTGHPLRPQPW